MTAAGGSWQPDPYGRHQLRWWDGVQWTSMVSDNGVSRDENAPAPQPVPVMPQQMPMQMPMQQGGPQPVPVMSQPSGPARKSRALPIAIIVAVLIIAVGVVVRVTRSDEGGGAGGPTGESQTAAGKEYVDAMVEGGVAAGTGGFSAAELRCLGESVVDEIGVEALQAAGITPEGVRAEGDLDVSAFVTQAQADQIATDITVCIDFAALIGAEMAGSEVQFTPEQMNCMGGAIEASDLVHEMFVQAITGVATQPSQQAADTLATSVIDCIDFGQLVTDSLASSGVEFDPATTQCIGEGMNSSELVRQMFVQQFLLSGGDSGEETTTSARNASNELIHDIVGNLFGSTDAATTDALTQELTAIFTGCGINLDG